MVLDLRDWIWLPLPLMQTYFCLTVISITFLELLSCVRRTPVVAISYMSVFWWWQEYSRSKTRRAWRDCGASARIAQQWTMTNSVAQYDSIIARASYARLTALADWSTSSVLSTFDDSNEYSLIEHNIQPRTVSVLWWHRAHSLVWPHYIELCYKYSKHLKQIDFISESRDTYYRTSSSGNRIVEFFKKSNWNNS